LHGPQSVNQGCASTEFSTLGIPNDFDLVIEPDKAAVACRVAWKNDRQMGVTFSDGTEKGARPNDSAGPKGERRPPPERQGRSVKRPHGAISRLQRGVWRCAFIGGAFANKPPLGLKWHQQLTENYGARELVSRCYEIIGMGKTSNFIRELRDKVAHHFNKEPIQLMLYLPKPGSPGLNGLFKIAPCVGNDEATNRRRGVHELSLGPVALIC